MKGRSGRDLSVKKINSLINNLMRLYNSYKTSGELTHL